LAELVALTGALEISKGQRINIYTDSTYAYLIYMLILQYRKKDNLKQQQGNRRTYSKRLRLLTDVYCPKEAAIMHLKGHSREGSKVAKGNQLANSQARKVTL
jgi:ribonuclease HI